MTSKKKRALISVYRKEGVVELGKGLVALGFEILSTGGTATSLTEAGGRRGRAQAGPLTEARWHSSAALIATTI